MVKFREAYDEDYDPRDYATPVGDEPSLTKQCFADECDINNIINKYLQGGDFTHVTDRMPVFGDFANVPDFSSMMGTIVQAQEAFADLPSKIRERFNNDPGTLIAFLSDDSNYDEAKSLGLVKTVSAPVVEATEDPAP